MADYKPSGTDTVIKIVLVFFISLLSFSIGTFVGKKFSDNQHKMAAMEPEKAAQSSHETEAVQEDTAKNSESETSHHQESANLTDEQVTNLEEEMATEESLASTAPKHEPKHEDTTTTEKPNSTDVPKLSKVLAKEVAAHGGSKFTIQIASYPTQEEAEKKAQELKSLKFESFTTEATIKGHQWYRVNVGMFPTIKEAQEHKSLLAERAHVSTAIIQKINQ